MSLSQPDLFDVGERVRDLPAIGSSNKYTCTADIPGTGPAGETCKSCLFYRRVQHNDYIYLKCGLMEHAWTRGAGTDIKARWPACSKWKPAETKSDA